MFERLRAFLRGRIYFEARGKNLARFLNEALKRGVVFFRTKRSEYGLLAQVSLDDFRKLRRVARLSRTRVRIRAKYGLPFILARWERRKGLLAGIVIIGVVLAILSQMVLSITVMGNKNLTSAQILEEAGKYGLRIGIWKKDLNLNQIAAEVQEQLPDAAWIGMESHGTRVEIRVVEKKRPQIPSEAGDLVASKAGLVQEIMVIQGIAQVHEGETVRAGQVLIAKLPTESPNSSTTPVPDSTSGKENQNSAKANQGQQSSYMTAAKGFVRGRVWYSAEANVPLSEDTIQESGRVTQGWGIKIGSRVIMVSTPNSPYKQAEKEVVSRSLFSWRNWRFPVEIINVKYKEVQPVHIERTVEQARQLAEEQARAELLKKIPPGVTGLEEIVRVLSSNPGIERVRVERETYEDLAVYANP